MSLFVGQTWERGRVKPRPGWRHLLKEVRRRYSRWLDETRTLEARLEKLAEGLAAFLVHRVPHSLAATDLARAVPAVLARCNDQSTYDMPMAAEAYAWLHFLDRYVRTWKALEQMVRDACLPLAARGVAALDVGTGPGPAAFAVGDFYRALTEFGASIGEERLHQPATVTCVELSPAVNAFRNHFVEFLNSRLELAYAIDDFKSFDPSEARVTYRAHLLDQEDYNEYTGYREPIYAPAAANDEAQPLHRYRLVVFSNFLTTLGTVQELEGQLVNVLVDLQPGSGVAVLGGSSGDYPGIYAFVDRLAAASGLTLCISDAVVAAKEVREQDIIFAATKRVYEHVCDLGVTTDALPKEVREHFGGMVPRPPRSRLRVYRKYRWHVRGSPREGEALPNNQMQRTGPGQSEPRR